jgi:hypothetical protein
MGRELRNADATERSLHNVLGVLIMTLYEARFGRLLLLQKLQKVFIPSHGCPCWLVSWRGCDNITFPNSSVFGEEWAPNEVSGILVSGAKE